MTQFTSPRSAVTGAPRVRLALPGALPAPLGYDAVGVTARHGLRIKHRLPRAGCVFTDDERWWWIVPAHSDAGLCWSPVARYATGALVAVRPGAESGPHLTHWPQDNVPYTHPLLLYTAVCSTAGWRPEWSATQ